VKKVEELTNFYTAGFICEKMRNRVRNLRRRKGWEIDR